MKQGGFGIQSLVRFQELLLDMGKVGPKDFLVFLCTRMIALCKSIQVVQGWVYPTSDAVGHFDPRRL